MTTLPAATVAPRSVTNLPTNSFSLSSFMALIPSFVMLPVAVAAGAHAAPRRRTRVAMALQCEWVKRGTGFSPGFSRCWRQETVMRAMYPDAEGFGGRGGVKVGYEVFGADGPAILLFTSWAIVHARQWKAQMPYLA